MTLVKRLIVKEWFSYFLGALIMFSVLISVGNIVSGLLRTNVSAKDVLFNHLIDFPNSLKMIFPIASLVATLFSLSKLQNTNQLSAIFSAGYSRLKFTQDLFFCSALSSIFIFALLGFVRPYLKVKKERLIHQAEAKFRNLQEVGLRSSTIGSGKIWFKNGSYFFSFSSYDRQKAVIWEPNIVQFKNHQIEKQIRADSAKNLGGNKWKFFNVTELSQLAGQTFPTFTKSESTEMELSESTVEFNQIEADITTLGLFSLYRYLSSLSRSGINIDEYTMLFLEPFSTAIICILMAFVSIGAVFNPNRRSSSFGKSVFVVFIIAIGYWLLSSYFDELGKSSQVSPLISSMIIPMMLLLIIIINYLRNREIK